MKTDARVRYTKHILRESLLGLLREKPIQKITVREVCDVAQLNRATFYKHYRDCYDLLEQIENDMLEDFRASLSQLDMTDATRLVNGILDMIDDNAELYRLLTEQHRDDLILGSMMEMAHDSAIGAWRAHLKNATDDEIEMLFTCVSHGLFQVVTEYYPRCGREAVTSFVRRTLESCLKPYA